MPRVQREFRRLKRVLRGRLARNVIALYGLRAFDQLLPLLVFWYLTRTLLPQGLGLFAFANACAMYGIVIVEYGFGFSGTRAVASARDQPGQLAELITGVFAVQVLLSVVVALAAAAARFLVPQFQEQPLLLWAGLAFAILQGFNPVWYFTGQERISLIVLVTAGVKLLTTLAIFALVGAPDDSWVVLACYAGGALLATTTGYALMMREVRPQRLSRGPIGRAFRLGASLFVMRVVLMTQGAGIVILLGFLAPHHVPLYAVSDKLCRPVAWLLGPLNTALLPRLSHLVGTSPDRAQQIARLSLLLQGTAGIAFGLTIALTAPWLIDLMFGQEYAAAAAALQVMATIIPLMVLNGALITQWMIPHGLDRLLNSVILTSFLPALVLVLILYLTHQVGAVGMAWTAVMVEASILIGLLSVLRHRCIKLVPARLQRRLCRVSSLRSINVVLTVIGTALIVFVLYFYKRFRW